MTAREDVINYGLTFQDAYVESIRKALLYRMIWIR